MIFRDLAINVLRSRLEVSDDCLAAAFEELDEQASSEAELAVDAIEAIKEQIPTLEGEHGNQFVRSFRSMLVSTDLSLFEALGLTDICETYYLTKLVNAIPTDHWASEIPDNENQLNVNRYTAQLSYWDNNGDEITVFSSSNSSQPSKSVALFKVPALTSNYLNDDHSTEIIGHGLDEVGQIWARLCACLLRTDQALSGNTFIICNKKQKSVIKTALDFHVIARGFLTAKAHKLMTIPGTEAIARHVEAARSNSQMNEPLEILSEINSRETILEKFLTSYHALENYMLRVKFAGLQNGMSDRTFRIRDLKVLGAISEERELSHLTQLFELLWDKVVCDTTLIEFTRSCLTNFRNGPCFNATELDEFLLKLGFTNNKGALKKLVTDENVRTNLPHLIYQVRCSIVHHKATEFHISNRTLENETVRSLHTKVLIPAMARIAYGLPLVTTNNPLRYNDRHLELY